MWQRRRVLLVLPVQIAKDRVTGLCALCVALAVTVIMMVQPERVPP